MPKARGASELHLKGQNHIGDRLGGPCGRQSTSVVGALGGGRPGQRSENKSSHGGAATKDRPRGTGHEAQATRKRPRGTGQAKLSMGLGAESQCNFHLSPLLSAKRGACAREVPVHTMVGDMVPSPTVSHGHYCSLPSASSDSDAAPVSGRSCPGRMWDALQRPHSTMACPPPGKAQR